jgi:hypothetical protein
MSALPDWQPLNGAPPPAPADAPAGRVVAVLATEGAVAHGWAPSAAIELARSWSGQGARVIIADGVLHRPSLHRAVGIANREGLSDAALHGASVSRVVHPLDEGAFFVVTAGTPVADSGAVVRSPRWYRIVDGMAEAGVTLMLYLNDGESGTAAFLGSASDIVVLSNPDDPPPAAVRDLEPLVRAVTGMGRTPAPEPREEPKAVEPAPAPVRAPVKKEKKAPEGVGRMVILVIVALVVAAGLGYLLVFSGGG